MNARKKDNKIRILILEPYYGGSHKQFLCGLQKRIDADFVMMTLPDRKWKMRMQLSAYWFVEMIKQLSVVEQQFDVVLCSTFVDVAVLKAELSKLPDWNQNTRLLTYFHENQFAYPNQVTDISNHQFTAINFTTAIASDALAFNSHYNLQSFIDGCKRYLKKAADMNFSSFPDKILQKSVVLYPGINFDCFTNYSWQKEATDPPVIVWNHRWEHDKDPETFFEALYELKRQSVSFRLILLGKAYRNKPLCFGQALETLKNQILHAGYVESYDHYLQLLHQGDFVVSTSLQEFYGISVIEAVRAGNRPLLPARLSYPELFDEQFLYDDGELTKALMDYIHTKKRLTVEKGESMTERFSWNTLLPDYEKWLFGRA